MNTTKRKLVNTAVDACSLYCQKCANEIDSKVPEKTIASSTSSRKLPETKIARPSYLPVPLKSSPVKSRTPSKNLNG